MNANESIPTTEEPSLPPPRVSRAALAFSLALFVIGCVFLGIALRRLWVPRENTAEMSKVNLEEPAKELLRKENPAPLSEPLEEILKRAEQVHFDSQPHPLLGKAAPEFTRSDADGHPWALKEATKKGPVVVVFYLGYYCNHCV